MSSTAAGTKRNDRCCLPYNDSLMIASQILSFFALALSWTTIWSLVIGLVTFILLQIVWCCKMRKCGLITTGIMAVCSGTVCVVTAILVLVYGADEVCNYVEDNATDDATITSITSNPDFNTDCTYGVNVYIGLSFASGALWLVTALLIFIFSCGQRYDQFHLPM